MMRRWLVGGGGGCGWKRKAEYHLGIHLNAASPVRYYVPRFASTNCECNMRPSAWRWGGSASLSRSKEGEEDIIPS